LSGYVLGVRPVTPGFQTWIVQPQPGDLQWAEGQTPTPYGPIIVKWGQVSGRLIMEVDTPPGTSGTLAIPKAKAPGTVMLNGNPVWPSSAVPKEANTYPATSDASFIYLNKVPGGHYRIECEP
jgi:alpha-L-rhamnosidase